MVQFDGISWDKGCQDGSPPEYGMDPNWITVRRRCFMSMKFPNFSFPNKKVKPGFQNLVNLDKREVIKYARLLTAKCEGKTTFWVNLSTPCNLWKRPDSSATFLSKLIFEISVIFCQSILVVNLSVRMWTKCMQSGESLKGWLATEYWWGKNGC